MRILTIVLALGALALVGLAGGVHIAFGALLGTIAVLFVFQVLLPRTLMNRRTQEIESKIGNCERKVVPVVFTRLWSWQKKIEIEDVKEEMALAGWQFLKATSAADSRMWRTMFGGIDVHFIRSVPGSETLPASECINSPDR